MILSSSQLRLLLYRKYLFSPRHWRECTCHCSWHPHRPAGIRGNLQSGLPSSWSHTEQAPAADTAAADGWRETNGQGAWRASTACGCRLEKAS